MSKLLSHWMMCPSYSYLSLRFMNITGILYSVAVQISHISWQHISPKVLLLKSPEYQQFPQLFTKDINNNLIPNGLLTCSAKKYTNIIPNVNKLYPVLHKNQVSWNTHKYCAKHLAAREAIKTPPTDPNIPPHTRRQSPLF